MSTIPRNDRSENLGSLTVRCRSEFREMPGLRLTLPHAARLFGIDLHTCEMALNSLVASGFLRKHGTMYQRVGAGRD